jgi:cell division protein FtsB
MKFEKSWSIGNAVTLMVIVGSLFTQYGISSQEVVVIKKDIEVHSVDIKENKAKIVKLEKDKITLEKDIESIKNTNERMESKINKILNALNVID